MRSVECRSSYRSFFFRAGELRSTATVSGNRQDGAQQTKPHRQPAGHSQQFPRPCLVNRHIRQQTSRLVAFSESVAHALRKLYNRRQSVSQIGKSLFA